MRYYQKVQWFAVVFMLLVGLVGCDSGDSGLTAPADVSTGSASPANFWVGRGGDKLQVYQEHGQLQITVPAGAYMLAYSSKIGGPYQIVFSSEEGAFLAIGLSDGDEFVSISLWKGAISETAVPDPEHSKEGVNVYCWPGSPTPIPWVTVFIFTSESVEIQIMVNGEFVPDNPFFVLIILTEPIAEVPEEQPWCDGESFIIRFKVTGPGRVTKPAGGRATEACANSSRSFKFTHDDRDFDTALDQVLANGVDVTGQVQVLGNGDGHLVIHKINEDILLEINFGP